MNIKILGSGCKKCVALAENAKAAAQAQGINAQRLQRALPFLGTVAKDQITAGVAGQPAVRQNLLL